MIKKRCDVAIVNMKNRALHMSKITQKIPWVFSLRSIKGRHDEDEEKEQRGDAPSRRLETRAFLFSP
jgi:hypothetical protein